MKNPPTQKVIDGEKTYTTLPNPMLATASVMAFITVFTCPLPPVAQKVFQMIREQKTQTELISLKSISTENYLSSSKIFFFNSFLG